MNNTVENMNARNALSSPLTLSPIQAQTTEVVTMKHLIGTAAIVVIIVIATAAASIFDVQQMIQSAEVSQNLIQSLDDQMLLATGGSNEWGGG